MTFIRPEAALYPMVHKWLQSDFKSSPAVEASAANLVVFTDDVSEQATQTGGLWSQPDLAAAVFSKATYVPRWTADLYSFEVKTGDGISQTSVYEAFAHTRFVNFSYLIWQVLPDLRPVDLRIIALCESYGLGAVTTISPDDPTSYRIHLTARRKETPPFAFDQFVRERFKPQVKRAIEDWLSSNGWASQTVEDGRF